MDLIWWLIPGLVAGLLAAVWRGSKGYTALGDVVVGMIGAVFGGWVFDTLGMRALTPSLPGSVLMAFSGAVLLLLFLRATRRRPVRRRVE